MKKSFAISAMVSCLFSFPLNAWADTQSYFSHLDAANEAVTKAANLRAPYAVRGSELSKAADKIANSAPFDCGELASQQSRTSEACDAYRQEQKSNYEQRARNNVILDRANALLQQANSARVEAENKLAHATIAAENADSPELRHLKGLQDRLVSEEKALKDFDGQMTAKGLLARAFAKLKDKAVDGERKSIAQRIEQARYNYLSALRVFKDIQLESRAEQLAVSLPEVSEKVLLAQDKSECIVASGSDGATDRAMGEVKQWARDFVDDITVRERHSEASRCGPQVATVSRVDRRPGFLQADASAPVEDRSTSAASAAGSAL